MADFHSFIVQKINLFEKAFVEENVGMSNFLFFEARKETCNLLGNWFGILIQLMLGVISFSALLYKLYTEHPRRPFNIWIKDTSKQALGAILAHVWNMIFASLLSEQGPGDKDPCVFYLVNYIVDTILGCLFNFLFLILLQRAAEHYGYIQFRSGYYGDPPSNSVWAIQTLTWCLIVTAVKFLLLFTLIVPLQDPMYDVASILMSPVSDYPKLELFMVMVLIPLIMNTVVFWVTDNVIMHEIKVDADSLPSSDKSAAPMPSSSTENNSNTNAVTTSVASVNNNDNKI